MKLPASVGQKKVKAIEQLLTELNLGEPDLEFSLKCSYVNDYIIEFYVLMIPVLTCRLNQMISKLSM